MDERALLSSLVAQLEGSRPEGRQAGEVPAEHYLSAERCERERQTLFARLPQIVAIEHELAASGSQLAVEIAGVSLLLVRDRDGALRAFRNACRHRSTRLVEHACTAKAIVCPYHGWTYDLAGRRLHAPHAEAFQGRDADRETLVPAFAAARHGFVWAGLDDFDLDRFLAPLEADLQDLGCSTWHLYQRSEHAVAGNWKLIIDAFLDGYHIKHLHRETLHPYFLDACFEAESAGPHIRSLVARRALLEAMRVPHALDDLRKVATPSYLIFPNTILILHPDYLSVGIATPVAADRTRFIHLMLIPELPRTEKEAAHWKRSFELIDRGVFASEDLAVVERMHRGLETGANSSQLFGEQEFPALWFHASVNRALARGG